MNNNIYDLYNMIMDNNPMMRQNVLTDEEISILRNHKNGIKLDIDDLEYKRALCNHVHNGRDAVINDKDEIGKVYCPVCDAKWNHDLKSKEEIQEAVTLLINQMQTMKWIGNLPHDVIRKVFSIIPILERLPDIHEYSVNEFNNYFKNDNKLINEPMNHQYPYIPYQGYGAGVPYPNHIHSQSYYGYNNGPYNQPQPYYGGYDNYVSYHEFMNRSKCKKSELPVYLL